MGQQAFCIFPGQSMGVGATRKKWEAEMGLQEFEQLKETVLRLEKEVQDLHKLVVRDKADAYNSILGVCK